MSRGYHHGNLRNALIMAAAELIEEAGSPEFAISDAAKRAGVSAAAPYRHFKDRDELLEAVSELCYLGLGEKALETREQFPKGSREGIVELGLCYLDYVVQRPAFYGIMWNDSSHDSATPDRQQETEDNDRAGFAIFVGAVQDWCEAQQLHDYDGIDLAVKMWAMAHGLAVLSIAGKIATFLPDSDVRDMLTSSANTFLDGVEKSHKG